MVKAERGPEPRAELRYTIALAGRKPDRPRLTAAEAEARAITGYDGPIENRTQ